MPGAGPRRGAGTGASGSRSNRSSQTSNWSSSIPSPASSSALASAIISASCATRSRCCSAAFRRAADRCGSCAGSSDIGPSIRACATRGPGGFRLLRERGGGGMPPLGRRLGLRRLRTADLRRRGAGRPGRGRGGVPRLPVTAASVPPRAPPLLPQELVALVRTGPASAELPSRLPLFGLHQRILTAGCLFPAVWNQRDAERDAALYDRVLRTGRG